MSVSNSILLLLCSFLCLTETKASLTDPVTDDKKEIIIVQIDEELNEQIVSLANYAYQLYKGHDRGMIKVTIYSDLNQEAVVTDLINMLGDKGVEKDDLLSEHKDLEVETAYFTISVSEGAAIQ